MSKAYYYVRNLRLPQVINLMCYTTKFPHSLTMNQRVLRMYRNFVRRQYHENIFENRADPELFHEQLAIAQDDFRKILNLKEETAEYVETLTRYEKWTQQHMDPTMLIDESRPYAANSSKYYVFNDDQLNFDPYGYYKPRSVAGRNPGVGPIYYADFPMEHNHWVIEAPAVKDITDRDAESFNQ